jgi:chromosome condensin MukBEF ATPase and DNA-binding subunit MukB
MSELTLESLARRLEEVERRLNEMQPSVIAPTRDWRSVIGISEDNEFTRLMLAEIEAAHEADRQAALSAEPS